MGGTGREVGVAGDCKGQVRTLAPGEGGGAWRAGLGGRGSEGGSCLNTLSFCLEEVKVKMNVEL